MEKHLQSGRGVFVAATLTTIGCVTVTQTMVYFLFQGQDLWAAMSLAPWISLTTAYPVSFFIWLQVRRNILLRQELQRLVNRDRLTDAATRDFFFAQMDANPESYGVSLMIDIDYFKSVNDTYGHQAGDAVISRVAEILRRNTRAKDIVCRYGGEEFIVFLSEQDRSGGIQMAERMRKTIQEETVDFEDHRLRVTVSIGGSLKDRLADINAAIREADKALYEAKSGGRNRTVFAGDHVRGPDQSAA